MAILSGGDITKRNMIFCCFTPEECEPFLKLRQDEIVFRKSIMYYLGIDPDKATQAGGCNEEQRAKCEYEFGHYVEWACKNCKEGGN